MNPSPALSLAGIEFRYTPDGQPVLRELSTDVPAGAITAILGPNGGGKTTLLHLLLGLLQPQAGRLLIAGRPPSAYSRRELSRVVGLVPQNEHIPFDFPVLDYVLLGRAPYLGTLDQPGDEYLRCARAALDLAGVAALCDRPVTALSGGERQLVMIARALAQNPRILLLDEPTSHLDLANRRAVHNVLSELAAAGVTVVFSSHDPNLVAAMADHVVLLRHGTVLAAGDAASTLTADLLGATYGIPVQVVVSGAHRMIIA